jgi:hypothetical protein
VEISQQGGVLTVPVLEARAELLELVPVVAWFSLRRRRLLQR